MHSINLISALFIFLVAFWAFNKNGFDFVAADEEVILSPEEKTFSKTKEVESTTENSDNKTLSLIVSKIVNRTAIEKNCTKLVFGKCWSSDALLPVCASNTVVYQNPGVLVCAQVCYPEIELELFCDPTKTDAEELKHCDKCAEKIAQVKAQQEQPSSPAEVEAVIPTGDEQIASEEETKGQEDLPPQDENENNEANKEEETSPSDDEDEISETTPGPSDP